MSLSKPEQEPGSIEMIPSMPAALITAVWNGNGPDSEWLIITAPPSFRASAERFRSVGFGVGSDKLRSGTICFQNSSCAESGNFRFGKLCGYLGPKRKMVHATSWLAENRTGMSFGGALPAATLLKPDGSKPE